MSAHDRPQGLRRTMNFRDVLVFAVITSFGLGMEVRAGLAGPAGVTFWVVGGLVFLLPLALGVIVLARRFPGEGGLYLWSRESFGDFAGFVAGWSYWACIPPYLSGVLYFVAGSARFVGGERYEYLDDERWYFIAVSLLCLAAATGLNLVGLRVGKWLHNLGVVGTWLPALLLIVLGLAAWAAHGPVTSMTAADFVPDFGQHQATIWPVLVMSLTGLEAASVLGDEIDGRGLPKAVGFAAVLGLVTKVLATLAALAVLLPQQMTGSAAFLKAFASAESRAGLGGLLPFVAALVA